MFRNIVFAAWMVGVLVGLVVTVPSIPEAETYESGGRSHGSADTHGSAGHIHGPGGHTHGPDGRMPGPNGHTHTGRSEVSRSTTGTGAVLVVAPHLLGAPQPEVPGGTAPVALADAFIRRAALVNAVFWLLLGGLGAWLFLELADRREGTEAVGSLTSNP